MHPPTLEFTSISASLYLLTSQLGYCPCFIPSNIGDDNRVYYIIYASRDYRWTNKRVERRPGSALPDPSSFSLVDWGIFLTNPSFWSSLGITFLLCRIFSIHFLLLWFITLPPHLERDLLYNRGTTRNLPRAYLFATCGRTRLILTYRREGWFRPIPIPNVPPYRRCHDTTYPYSATRMDGWIQTDTSLWTRPLPIFVVQGSSLWITFSLRRLFFINLLWLWFMPPTFGQRMKVPTRLRSDIPVSWKFEYSHQCSGRTDIPVPSFLERRDRHTRIQTVWS